MYPEITSRLKAIEDELNSPNFYHVDQRMARIVERLCQSLEFLAMKVYELDPHKPKKAPAAVPRGLDPHRHLPGNDD